MLPQQLAEINWFYILFYLSCRLFYFEQWKCFLIVLILNSVLVKITLILVYQNQGYLLLKYIKLESLVYNM